MDCKSDCSAVCNPVILGVTHFYWGWDCLKCGEGCLKLLWLVLGEWVWTALCCGVSVVWEDAFYGFSIGVL
ncbi:unnamed protein product [Adineta ricciae]|nr:unnamed protein product [Adineta ricciae]